jgi:uncharacterized metal-binding protein YceD (DUF177 family)
VTHTSEWTLPIVVAELPNEGAEFEIVPDEATLAMLAEHTGVLAIPHLAAHVRIAPEAGGAVVDGSLRATVRQTCVITLEPFDNTIDEPISVRFVAPELMPTAPTGDVDAGADDPPDPLVDGRIDIAAVITEFLTLSIDPYPRKPGAVFEAPREEAARESPFAPLAKLKDDEGGEKS